MKVAVSANGESLDAGIDPRFGRCAYFLIVDSDTLAFEAFANEHASLAGGAGIQSAQFVASKGAEAVITGRCGPNAVLTLSSAGVVLYEGQDGVTIPEALEKLKKGALVATEGSGTRPSNVSFSGSGRGMGGRCGGGRGMGMGGGGRGMGMAGGGRGMGGGGKGRGM